MSCKVEKLEGSMAKLTIEVDASELDKAINQAYNNQKNSIQLPGFRKGKTPKAVIEKMYGKSVFYEEAANIIIPDAYAKAYDECGEEITSAPDIEVTQLEAGKPFIFTATVALKPEIKLGNYKGVQIDKIDTNVTDEEVMAFIEKERENSARTISVDRPVQDKDEVTLDFEGSIDGIPFEGGKGENYPLTIGSGSFIPGFEEQLIGAEKENEVEVKVTFPEDYHAEDLKGKEAVFKCTIHEIKEKELPELDDEFASEVSEYDTFDEYKAATVKGLTEKKENDAKNKKEEAVIEAIVKDSEIEIPGPMLDAQIRQMFDDFSSNIQQNGISLEQYFQFTGLTREKLLEQIKPGAKKRIESRLVLENVVKAEGFTVSDEEYEAELNRMAEAYKMELDKVKELIGDNEKAKKEITDDLAIKKAIDFVIENAKEA